jgi:hypothetical protein
MEAQGTKHLILSPDQPDQQQEVPADGQKNLTNGQPMVRAPDRREALEDKTSREIGQIGQVFTTPPIQLRTNEKVEEASYETVLGGIGWLPLVLLTACVTSHTGKHQAATLRPAVNRLLNRGDTRSRKRTCRTSGLTQAPSMASIRPRRRRRSGPIKPDMASRSRACWITRPASSCFLDWTSNTGDGSGGVWAHGLPGS